MAPIKLLYIEQGTVQAKVWTMWDQILLWEGKKYPEADFIQCCKEADEILLKKRQEYIQGILVRN